MKSVFRPFLSLALLFILALPLYAENGTQTQAAPASQFFDSTGVKIHYKIHGPSYGEPIVLVHGYTANMMLQWEMPGIVADLSKDFKVIVLDNRGHGQSDKPHDPAAYGDEMVRDVVRLMDHLKIDKAHIAGYSMGGFITMRMLELHPERMLSAMPTGAGWANGKDDPNAEFLDELATALESGKGIEPLIMRLTPEGRPKPTPEQIQQMNTMLTAMNDVKALAACARGMKGLTVKEETLRNNKVPVLSIIGSIDPLKTGVDAMNGVIENAEFIVIEGADHMTAFSSPEFVAAMRKFLIEVCKCACLPAAETSAYGG